jgi:hypothetical protein
MRHDIKMAERPRELIAHTRLGIVGQTNERRFIGGQTQ